MSLGRHVLEFRARSPLTNKTAACQMIIHVKDTEPPRVSTCPHSFVDYLGMTTKYPYKKSTTAYSMSPRRNRTLPTPLSPASVPLPPASVPLTKAHSPTGEGLGESQFRRLEKKLSTLHSDRCHSARDSEFITYTVKKDKPIFLSPRDVTSQTLHGGE
jgi:hypothetical protein